SQTEQQSCIAEQEQACLGFVGSGKLSLNYNSVSDDLVITNLASESSKFLVSEIDPATGATVQGPFIAEGSGGVEFTTGQSVTVTDANLGAGTYVVGNTIRVIPYIQRTVNNILCDPTTCSSTIEEVTIA
ncbi:MAG: hypothetical protein AABY07_09025, partial [Nanoarchaeota archaeon]